MSTQILDRPPAGAWHALRVMKEHSYKWDWVALMIDVHPEDYRAGAYRTAREAVLRIPGKHRNKDAAWDALEDMMTTRH